jgi:hypothetical protein
MKRRKELFDMKQTEAVSLTETENNGFFGPIKKIGKRRIKLWLNTGM